MVDDIERNRFIKILPLKQEHLETYAKLEINEAQDYNDPTPDFRTIPTRDLI